MQYGEDIQHIVIFIPTSGQPNLKEAIDRAIESVPGSIALVDARLYTHTLFIPLIYGEAGYIVQGTALVNHSQAAIFPTRHIVIRFDSLQNRYIAKGVTPQEYAKLKAKFASAESRNLSI